MGGLLFNNRIPCARCGGEVPVNLEEYIDAGDNPSLKKKVIDGSFFTITCPHCGLEAIVEYPVMYFDPEKKLNIYMVPRHSDNLIKTMNSLEMGSGEVDRGIYRLTGSAKKLTEKIQIFERNRDDRFIEFYKLMISERLKKDWPDMSNSEIVYGIKDEKEYFIVWDSTPGSDCEKLTVELDEEAYIKIEKDFRDYLKVEPGKYAEVDGSWILGRLDVGQ